MLGASAASRGPRAANCPAASSRPREFDAQVEALNERYPNLADKFAAPAGPPIRHAGRDAARRRAKRMQDLGERFGADLTQREVDYLIEHEWARTADDILWRRTKLGLRVGAERQGAARGLSRRRARRGEGNERLRPRHRPGHDLEPGHRLQRPPADRRHGQDGVHPALSRPRAGSSTCPRKSGRRACGPCKTALKKAGITRRRHRRHRHHQPARNHDRVGPRDRQGDPQRHRLAGPAHRASSASG